MYEDDQAEPPRRSRNAQPRRALRPATRVAPDWLDRTGPAFWISYLLHEPRDFVYCVPRRIACRLLGRHNPTCLGRPAPHPRRW
ncbi:hypothetical protein [Streptomyces kebangsaanensis]|uniref:hypothetical protein n=1 Tax=Streptomyces kebangsaanensis TaxID=864058 RepID=UPI000A484581|nr:hypothetical protein [Streptomyces kebangsaanensis]